LLLILTILLFSETTELYQLVKLPALYTHYQAHQKLNPEVSFLTYLSMHYLGDDDNKNDDEEDMKLPFKKSCVDASSFLATPTIKTVAISPQEWPVKENFGAEHSQFYFNPAGQSLFRPPRV
jgi:hypothetical protein